MAEIFPFRGEIYNQEYVDIEKVVAPPYDVISKEEEDIYYKKSPYNIIRFILPKGEDKYNKAKETLTNFRRENILIRDDEEYFYLYEKEWEIWKERGIFRGIIASLEIEDYEKGIILPHERIIENQRNDRLKLLSSCKTDFCPIFLIFSNDKEINIIPEEKPFIEFSYKNGLFCRVFRIRKTEEIKEGFKDKKLFIADGHHRYDAALTYFKETHSERKRIMALISSIEYGGFKVLPPHRVLKNFKDIEKIREYFNLEEKEKENIFSYLCERKEPGVFGFLGKDFSFIISLKDEKLLNNIKEELRPFDVCILHKLLFGDIDFEEGIEYIIDRDLVFEKVENGFYAFLLRPVNLLDVIGLSGNRLPGKATYFYPKPFSGLIMHPLCD